MSYQDEIQELLKYSSSEIKGNKALFSDFVRLYIADGGNKSDCMGCNFNNVYNRWKRGLNNPKKTTIMSTSKNTFVLNQPGKLYHELKGNYVFSQRSSDETAIKWISEHKGAYVTEREKVFSKLPEGYGVKEEVVVEETVSQEVSTEEVKTDASKKRKRRRK